jgi:hypothetical protein
VLSRSVAEARGALGLGAMTGDPSSATPVAEILGEDTARIETAKPEEKRGLRHRLPAFLQRLGGWRG